MRTGCEVTMPQMGDSIAEGTITKWLVEVGSRVERDQPLFEIATDKVDAEIPSPASGVLTQIYYTVGATVPVNTVVAFIMPHIAEPPPLGENIGTLSTGLGESSLGRVPQPQPEESYARAQGNVDSQSPAPILTRSLWSVLAVLFGALLFWRLYEFSREKEKIYESLMPAAFLLLSIAQLVIAREGLVYKLLLLASVMLMLAGLLSLVLMEGA